MAEHNLTQVTFSQKKYSRNLYITVVAFIVVLSGYFSYRTYDFTLRTKERDNLRRLSSIAKTAAVNIDGDEFSELMLRNSDSTSILQNSDDSLYLKYHKLLYEVEHNNELGTDTYTLTKVVLPDTICYLFGIASGEKPYFRHEYHGAPEVINRDYAQGGVVPYYTDDHGGWLTAFEPIRDSGGEVVAVLMVDQRFDDFQAEAREILYEEIGVSLLIIVVMSALLFPIIQRIISQEERVRQRLAESNSLIEERNKKITDSINYAKRIQDALLDNQTALPQYVNDYFQIFLPKDIVSGDFYWYFLCESSKRLYIANVDCTGHGVPGALMSILGYSSLNEIITVDSGIDPNQMLSRLDEKIRTMLSQSDPDNVRNDGMDMGVVVLDYKNMLVHFSGAHHPLLHVSGQKVETIKGDRFAIGGRLPRKPKHFTCKTVEIRRGDRIYLYTDGIVDQFGGIGLNGDSGKEAAEDKSEKFKTRRFRELVLKIQELPMRQQRDRIVEAFESWKGNLSQLDDVSIIGIEV